MVRSLMGRRCQSAAMVLGASASKRIASLTTDPTRTRSRFTHTPLFRGARSNADALGSGSPSSVAPKDRARHEARAAGVVVIEESSDQLAGGVQTGDRTVLAVEHAPIAVDA